MSPASESYSATKKADAVLSPIIRTALAKDGFDLYLWDIAVACLSLSVKVILRRAFLTLKYTAHESLVPSRFFGSSSSCLCSRIRRDRTACAWPGRSRGNAPHVHIISSALPADLLIPC